MVDKCKLTVSLGLAALAGLTAMAAGLMSEARVSVILGRTLCSFFITGVLVYIGVFLFDRFSFAPAIREAEGALAELQAREAAAEGSEEKGAGDEASGGSAADGMAAEGESQAAGGNGAPPQDGFAPLQTDSLKRVAGSADNQ